MTQARYILWLDDEAAAGNPLLGGKFATLAQMTKAGISVPRGFGITTTAYRDFLHAASLVDEANRVREAVSRLDLSEIEDLTANLRQGILTAPLPPALEGEIRANYLRLEQLTGISDIPVAVRSSGESEDRADASFAGLYQTYLWISGIEDVLEHTRECWASMFGNAVLSYLQKSKTLNPNEDFGICVGIQQMVQARAAGVMFTLDPLRRDRSKILLEACWGLGEGVVKGDVTPTQFLLDKVTFEVLKRKISPQPEEYCFDPATGAVGLVPIEPERQNAACISDDEVEQLASLAKSIEAEWGMPQDIEWAVSQAGEVWILQARPETIGERWTASRVVSAPKSPVAHVLARLSGIRTTSNSESE
jgi:pyruvate,water dikinase